MQGDVIAITNANGAVVARYTYDAWGVPTIKEDTSGYNIATVNPFRYRGYYYDAETNLYYLQSRYYDPEVGRFINADEADAISIDDNVIAHNLFVYVENNPINNTDYQGNFSINTILKYLKKVVGFFGKAAEFLLKYFGIGRRKYNRRNKYNNKNDIYNFVYENKKALKKMKKSANTVAKIIEIIMLAVDLGSIVKKHSNQYKMVAELLFYGLVELICWAAPKIITFIVTKIFAVLFAVKSLIEKIFGYVFSKLKESSFAERVKSNYMNNVKESGMSFGDYFVALFQGMVGAMTT